MWLRSRVRNAGAYRVAVVVEEEARVGVGGGEVPARRPLRHVVVEHELRRDVADAVDRDHHVLRVAEGIFAVPPVGHPEGDEDHARVRAEAHEVEPPHPLRLSASKICNLWRSALGGSGLCIMADSVFIQPSDDEDDDDELWSEVYGITVSSVGRVKLNGRAFVPTPDSNGYCRVTRNIGDDAGTKSIMVHKLVALAFIGPQPSANHTVDHINRITSDNRVANLRWADVPTQSKNRDNPTKLQSRRKVEVSFGNGEWVMCDSVTDACAQFSLNSSHIMEVLQGKAKQAKGALVRYAKEPEIAGEVWGMAHGIAVSTAGRLKRKDGAVFVPVPCAKKGYCRTMGFAVHQLVALAFLGTPPSSEHTVDHIDRNRSNNCVENLRWATKKEQRANSARAPRTKSGRWVKVKATDQSGGVQLFAHKEQAREMTGISLRQINKALAGKPGPRAGPLVWEYA